MYLFFCFWTSLVAQLVKKPPAMWEAWVQSLGWEDPLEKGTATHSRILAWRILENSMDCIVHVVTKSQTLLSDFHFDFSLCFVSYSNLFHKYLAHCFQRLLQFLPSHQLPSAVTLSLLSKGEVSFLSP